jgi:hypothetical protein
LQNAAIVQRGDNFLTKNASFILDTACTNVVDDLFLAEAYAASTGVAVANIKIPITGIWSLCWTARFLNTSAENGTFFPVQNSKFYNDTSGHRRLAFNGTASYDCNATWTGYIDAGDVLGLCAYSTATGNTLKPWNTSCLIATLVSATALRISATPVIPSVITS